MNIRYRSCILSLAAVALSPLCWSAAAHCSEEGISAESINTENLSAENLRTESLNAENLSEMNGPNPAEVYVQSISYGGTGCPNGSVGQSISDDRKTFTLIFDTYVASVGPGVPVTESRKNCQLNINLHVPQGWSYTFADVAYRGYVGLSAGQTATQKSIYYFAGQTQQASAGTNFVGPVSKDYLVSDRVGLESLVWSQCNAVVPLNINSQVRITGDLTKPGQITTDSVDGKVKHIFGIMWRKC